MKVLAIDDDPTVREFIADVFETGLVSGEVLILSNGRDAAEACRKTQFDLILTDHIMPGKTGLEFIMDMKLDLKNPNHKTPVVMITGALLEKEIEYMLLYNVRIMRKPFGAMDIANAINESQIRSS
jgi:CheY-like chemotaxis protein